jgi:hypothetical protein
VVLIWTNVLGNLRKIFFIIKVSYSNWAIKTLYKITHAIVISSVASLTSFRTFNDSPELATE